MNSETLPSQKPASTGSTFSRVARFAAVRGLTITIAVFVGLFAAVYFVNQGGFIDQIYADRIEWSLFYVNRDLPPDMEYEKRVEYLDEIREAQYAAYGLDRPFLERCFEWWKKAITLDWGETRSSFGQNNISVRQLVAEKLGNSMLLFGAGSLLTFFLTIGAALFVSRHFGSWLDKMIIILAPISTAPNWLYGIILVAIFSIQLNWLPASGMYEDFFGEVVDPKIDTLVKHSILPVLSIFCSMFIQGVYSWRTFFIKSANADHLDLAKAMGLPQNRIERKHILRPTLPYIITNLTMMLLAFWQSIIALEVFFDWPGIGQLFLQSFSRLQNDVAIAVIVIFAYLMAVTVFSLDFIYALVDPRVRIKSESRTRIRLKGSGIIPSVRGWLSARLKRADQEINLPQTQGKFWHSQNAQETDNPDGDLVIVAQKKESISSRLSNHWAQIKKYPTALVGIGVILLLVLISAYTVLEVPQEQAIVMWRGERFDTYKMPELAEPAWFNWFRNTKEPETIYLDSTKGQINKNVEVLSDTNSVVTLEIPIEYPYAGFPQDIKLKFYAEFESKQPMIVLTWITPDGVSREVDRFSTPSGRLYSFFFQLREEMAANRMIYGNNPMHVFFQDPESSDLRALEGTYYLQVDAYFYEPNTDLDVEFAMLGQVYGLGGTDIAARDLGVGLLWGLQMALIFGLVGALMTNITTMLIAAIGTWFGGWLDRLIQMITEVNMILPMLAIAITIGHAYEATIWTIMGIVILLSIFGNNIKNYRSVFLQVKESPYIEAAKAYGTSNWRIITRYLIPEILPILIPQLVISVPTFVYIESTLAFLGVTGLYLPSLGKIIAQAFRSPYLDGKLFWILEPTALLLLIGFGFSMLGIALDRILNPTLQER